MERIIFKSAPFDVTNHLDNVSVETTKFRELKLANHVFIFQKSTLKLSNSLSGFLFLSTVLDKTVYSEQNYTTIV